MKHRFLPFRNGKILCEDSPRRTEEKAMIAEKSDRENTNKIIFTEKREKKRRDSLVSPNTRILATYDLLAKTRERNRH